MRVIIDGQKLSDPEAVLSVFDWAVVRGYGCFEVVRSYGGRVFRLDQHLDRLAHSAAVMGLEPPARNDIAEWINLAAAAGDGQVRCVLTGGGPDPLYPARPRTIVTWEPLPALPELLRIEVRPAPWHPAGRASELTGAKTLSYAPNMAATRAARAAGYDDALLVSDDSVLLEGPAFSIAWFRDGRLETPSLLLHILASITRSAVLELAADLGYDVHEGSFHIDDLRSASDVVALSTLKEVHPVGEAAGVLFSPGDDTARLRSAFRGLVAREVGG